jgi:hypothetical protein
MATTWARGFSANPCKCKNPTPQPIIPIFSFRESVTFTPVPIERGCEHGT